MSVSTYGFNVEGSFHTLVEAQLAIIQTEINAALSTSHTIAYYPQRQIETFPSVRGWVFMGAEADDRRHRLTDRIQLDIFVKSANASYPDRRLAMLIRDGLMSKLGFSTKRSAFFAHFDVKNYFANPSSPTTLNKCRIEQTSPWQDLPPSDPLITQFQSDFKLIHL